MLLKIQKLENFSLWTFFSKRHVHFTTLFIVANIHLFRDPMLYWCTIYVYIYMYLQSVNIMNCLKEWAFNIRERFFLLYFIATLLQAVNLLFCTVPWEIENKIIYYLFGLLLWDMFYVCASSWLWSSVLYHKIKT